LTSAVFGDRRNISDLLLRYQGEVYPPTFA
jgi:hypothetical protein